MPITKFDPALAALTSVSLTGAQVAEALEVLSDRAQCNDTPQARAVIANLESAIASAKVRDASILQSFGLGRFEDVFRR